MRSKEPAATPCNLAGRGCVAGPAIGGFPAANLGRVDFSDGPRPCQTLPGQMMNAV
jgi:hypothetical protein